MGTGGAMGPRNRRRRDIRRTSRGRHRCNHPTSLRGHRPRIVLDRSVSVVRAELREPSAVEGEEPKFCAENPSAPETSGAIEEEEQDQERRATEGQEQERKGKQEKADEEQEEKDQEKEEHQEEEEDERQQNDAG